MWTIISRLGQLVGLVSPEPAVDLQAIAAVLDEADYQDEETATEDAETAESNTVLCQHRVGVVAELLSTHGYIRTPLSGDDGASEGGLLYFRREDGPAELAAGDSVVYLAYRLTEDSNWVVRKILYVENQLWDKQGHEEEEVVELHQPVVREECETAYKHVIGQVTGRKGRTVLVGQLEFSLDSVQIDFIPVEGDWLMLHSLVQTERVADTLLLVDKVTALRSQQLDSKVSHWSQDTLQGILDSEVVFTKEVCEPGYQPRVGDEVRVLSIESDQGQLLWRALQVVPTIAKPLELNHDPQALMTLLQDKQGVVVSEDTNCGTLNIGQERHITIEVKNKSESLHSLLAVELTAPESQFQLVKPANVHSKVIHPHKSLQFDFNVKGRFVGRSTELVVFKFDGFDIGRQLVVNVQTAALAASLSNQGGRRSQRNKQESITAKKLLATRNGFIVPGVRPIQAAKFVPVKLGMFVLPDKLINTAIGTNGSSRSEETILRLVEQYRYLGEPLSAANYVVRWGTLLHLEELEHRVNIARYDKHAALHRVQDYLSLEIPGLSERRPSLIVGDRVIVRQAASEDNCWASDSRMAGYEGYIHKVLSNEVLLKFNADFHNSCMGVYSVSFEANRTSFRREHQAVHIAFRNLSTDWLFPSRISCQSPQIVIVDEEDYIRPLNKEEVDVDQMSDSNTTSATSANEGSQLRETNSAVEDEEKTEEVLSKSSNGTGNVKSNIDSVSNYVDTGNTLTKTNKPLCKSNSSLNEEAKIEILNCESNESNLNNTDFILVEKSIDEVLNAAINIVGDKRSSKVKEHVVKRKVSDMFENLAPKEDSQLKISPPRVPVVARFLQNGNCPSVEKSPKEVKSMLQQLASLSSTNEKLSTNNKDMKTLEEIEKSMLNCSNGNVLAGIQPLPQEKEGSITCEGEISPFENLLKSNNVNEIEVPNPVTSFLEKEQNCHNSSESDNKLVEGGTRKAIINNVNKLTKASRKGENKINWNSSAQIKLGNEMEAKVRISKRNRRKLRWFNPVLNHFQKEAVRNILQGEARPMPYVIFGPPGTGKTITLVETALQIYSLIPESRLLVGTPSNSSADLVAERLLDSGLLVPGDLLRLVGHHYLDQDKLPETLRPYCGAADIRDSDNTNTRQEGVVNISRHAIGRHRITVGTCNTLAVLYQMGFPRGHFTHVLIDEAGQATEPEILIPLVFLDKKHGQAVLAGDPLQLGPVVLSKVAQHFGLGESLLSRLLTLTPYTRDPVGFPDTAGYNPLLLTRLRYNYRSLPEILSLPDSMFYNNDLIAQVSPVDSEEAEVLARLGPVLPPRRQGGPPALVFHGVRGTNCQATDSPSWHNPHEAVQATMYLQALYDSGLTPEQCGIITPYQAQVLRIRQMLEKLEVPVPKVGSVEEFQGQERMAIILSAVRSSPRLLEADMLHAVGFVACPRRLNVALTRARATLILLGNPHLLARDHCWRTVLEYCLRHGAYTGCDLPADIKNHSEAKVG